MEKEAKRFAFILLGGLIALGIIGAVILSSDTLKLSPGKNPLGTQKCGNGICESTETCSLCSADCGICPSPGPVPRVDVPFCGDGEINREGELCDGVDLNDMDCTDFGFDGGTLLCTRQCTFDLSGCVGGSAAIEIWTREDLENIADNLQGNYIQMQDIDLSEIYWDPIGDATQYFRGSYDGNGFAMLDMNINLPTEDNVGLFGYAVGAEIKNVRLMNINVSGNRFVGGLIGNSLNNIIDNVDVMGDVSASLDSVGLLIGSSTNDMITNIQATGNVFAYSENAGGLIGVVSDGTQIYNSITGGGVVDSGAYAGGLVGLGLDSSIYDSSSSMQIAYGDDSSFERIHLTIYCFRCGGLVGLFDNSVISNSHASGKVYARLFGGGLVGTAWNTLITNSWASGNVSGRSSLGGLLGEAYSNVTIEDSHATGSMAASTGNIGGLVGFFQAQSKIRRSYATGAVSSESDNIGGLVGFMRWSSLIDESYATGSITPTHGPFPGANPGDMVGGLVGKMYSNSRIINSHASGSVFSNDKSGGLLGNLVKSGEEDNSRIINSYSTTLVSSYGAQGGLIGFEYGFNGLGAVNSYWDINTSGQNQSAGGEGRTTAEMTTVPPPTNTYVDWDFANIWEHLINGQYPRLQWQ